MLRAQTVCLLSLFGEDGVSSFPLFFGVKHSPRVVFVVVYLQGIAGYEGFGGTDKSVEGGFITG